MSICSKTTYTKEIYTKPFSLEYINIKMRARTCVREDEPSLGEPVCASFKKKGEQVWGNKMWKLDYAFGNIHSGSRIFETLGEAQAYQEYLGWRYTCKITNLRAPVDPIWVVLVEGKVEDWEVLGVFSSAQQAREAAQQAQREYWIEMRELNKLSEEE